LFQYKNFFSSSISHKKSPVVILMVSATGLKFYLIFT